MITRYHIRFQIRDKFGRWDNLRRVSGFYTEGAFKRALDTMKKRKDIKIKEVITP